jgi:anti-sigma factor RsiW
MMMPPDPRQIDEWLSGLLDGVLSDNEQRELESAMQHDPSIAQRLEELSVLRRALLQGRPVGRLGADFAKRVVQATRDRACDMDAPPAWVLPDAPNAVAPQSHQPSSHSNPESESQWSDEPGDLYRPIAVSMDMSEPLVAAGPAIQPRGLIGSGEHAANAGVRERFLRSYLLPLAVAAALVALFLLLPGKVPKENSLAPIAETQSRSEVADPQEAIAQSGQNPQIPEETPDDLDRPNPNGITPKAEGLMASNPAGAAPSEQAVATDTATLAESDSKPQATGPETNFKKMALVANIWMDAQASQNDALEVLLDKYQIITGSDAVLNRNEVDTLVSSQVLKCGPLEDSSAKEKLNVYVVKASLVRLDSFLQDVEKQYMDFPSYHLNLSFDPSIIKLLDNIVGITDSPQTAKRLFFEDIQTGHPAESIEQPKSQLQKNRLARNNFNQPNAVKPFRPSQDEGFLILVVREAE